MQRRKTRAGSPCLSLPKMPPRTISTTSSYNLLFAHHTNLTG
jgi:hypothetical protein